MNTDPTAMINAILAAVQAHAWPLVLALIVGGVVRLTKPDVRWAPSVPPRFRPLVAVAVGAVGAACDAIAAGTPWQEAAKTAAAAVGVAILGHTFGVEVLRGGREIPVPGAAPPVAVLLLLAGLGAGACHGGTQPRTVEAVVVTTANDALPVLLATYDRETAAAVAEATSHADAEARLDAVVKRWRPVWDAWRALRAADGAARSGALCALVAAAQGIATLPVPAGVCS